MSVVSEFLDRIGSALPATNGSGRPGGISAVASELGLPMTTVASWKARGSIPVDRWPDLIALSKRLGVKGVNAEILMWIHIEHETSASKLDLNDRSRDRARRRTLRPAATTEYETNLGAYRNERGKRT